MSKYEPLGVFLKSQPTSHVPMTFAEIEGVVGMKLPNSAYRHRPWWSNNPSNSVMTKVWLEAGFVTEQVDMEAKKLVFKRTAQTASSKLRELEESSREFAVAGAEEKKPRRSPLFGALKGTFWIDPTWDLTQPSLDLDELAEIEANIQRTADLIEAGLSKKRK